MFHQGTAQPPELNAWWYVSLLCLAGCCLCCVQGSMEVESVLFQVKTAYVVQGTGLNGLQLEGCSGMLDCSYLV